MAETKRRIVILGGGVASLTTAYALTAAPGWRERYDITLYQMGFRLGGKGASGRNRRHHDRIEEHGIHVFFGFYDNAFRVMRECYEELDRPLSAPLARVTDAFKPAPRITFAEKIDGAWSIWPWESPANDAELGRGGPIPTPWGHVRVLLDRMVDWYQQVVTEAPPDVQARLARWTLVASRESAEDLLPRLVETLWRRNQRSALEVVREVIGALQRSADRIEGEPDRSRREHRAALAQLVKRVRLVRGSARWMSGLLQDIPTLRRALVLLDFATTTILGLIEDEVIFPPEDWRKIDGVDLKKWLHGHGAAPTTSNCALIQGMYAGIFSTVHEVGAGTMLQYTLRLLFTYRGAVLYKMQAGMGDTVFVPLYEVLRRRGVKFEFFHRVDRLELDPAREAISRITLGRQASVKQGTYQPLYDVAGLPCWPSEPLYEQLVEGEALRASGAHLEDAWTAWQDPLPPLVLEAGRDFDQVVLGISLGALSALCRDLVEDPGNPRFRNMLAALATTPTQAMQLWLHADLARIGWHHGNSITIPYEEPYDTWTDMAHLVPRESWPAGEVGGIAYLCSPLPEVEPMPPPGPAHAGYAQHLHERTAANAREWLERFGGWLWPGIASGRGIDWNQLVDPTGRSGVDRLATQHFAAPMNPSDRYNLSVPGSAAFRLPADGSGYRNLTLAGDWTLNPINAGCVEAATMSGLLAAQAISGEPVAIPGDWLSPLLRLGGSETGPRQPGLPLYIGRDTNDTPLPPYTSHQTRMTVFPVAARLAALEALCRRFLQLGGPVRYRPLAPLVLFYCQDNRLMASSQPTAAIRELDFGFLVPLLAEEPGRGARVVAFTPYLWVDSELACRAGRELYGYPKAVGNLGLPVEGEGVFSLDGMVAVASEAGPGTWEMRRLVEARPRGPAATDATSPKEPLQALARLLGELGGPGTTRDLLRAGTELAAGVVPMVFLKQFRDVADPSRACYQAIVEASARKTGPLQGGLLRQRYELAVHNLPGLPLASLLGLAPENHGPGEVVVPVRGPLWLEFDFQMAAGREVWRATP